MKKIKFNPKLHLVYINSKNPHQNYYYRYLPKLYLGRLTACQKYRILCGFSIEDIPDNAEIIKATIHFKINVPHYSQATSVTSYLINEPWNIYNVNWCSQPRIDYSISGESVLIDQTNAYHFDVTNIVKRWVEDGYNNHGIMFESHEHKNNTFYNVFNKEPLLPEIEIEYQIKCHECIEIPKFYNDSTKICVDDNYTHVMDRNTSLFTTLTYFIENKGDHPITAHLQISPDHHHFETNSEELEVLPGETKSILPYVYAKYTRASIKTINPGTHSFVRVWLQAQL